MKAIAMPLSFDMLDINRRDVMFLGAAAVIHSLLFLWGGAFLEMPTKERPDMGDPIVQVQFIDQVPPEPVFQETKKDEGLFSKMKKFFTAPESESSSSQLAQSRAAQKIDAPKKSWDSAEPTLKPKEFKKTADFSSSAKIADMGVTKGTADTPQIASSLKVANPDSPQLKSKSYRLAQNDVPFQIKKAKSEDALSNINAVAVNVGRKTSSSVKALETESSGPNLKSKTLATGGSAGAFGSAGTSSKGFGSLATGGSQKIDPRLASGSAGSGSTSGSSSGSSGSGISSSYRGSGALGSSSMASLPRNTVGGGDGEGMVKSSGGDKGAFEIKGALAGRRILDKVLPAVREDVRASFRFQVDWAGRVLQGIVILVSSGFPSIDNQLLEALQKWVFEKLPPERSKEIQEGVITFRFRGR